jgi:EmrB/QacA subfamily drug resistance transporter
VNEAHPNRKWYTLAAMCFALFMIMLDNTVVNVALPSIQKALKTNQSSLEWTINAYVVTFAALILLGGKLGDRFGRKRMFLVGLAIFTISSAACALSTTDTQLIAFRAVQGAGGALMNPLSLSIIVTAFPRRQVATAIGIWAGISSLGLALGPLLGGFLVDQVDWSAVFWINVPIGVIAAAVTIYTVDESRDPTAKTLDIIGTVLVTGGLFALVYGLIETNTHAWLSAYTLGFMAIAAVLLVCFVVWESRVPDPMVPLGFFRKISFDASAIVVALVGFSLFGIIFFLTLYFQNVRGYSAQGAGALTLPLTGMTMVVAPLAGKLNPRVGPRVLMTVGMLLTSGALFTLSQIGVHSSYATMIAPAYLAMGIGIAMTMPTTASTAMGSVSPDKAGIASGVVNASRQVGGALGIAVLGTVGASVASSHWSTFTDGVPASSRPKLAALNDAVIGGQSRVIGQIAGPQAQDAAASSFVHGLNAAMYVGSGLTLIAAFIAFFGLKGFKEARAQAMAEQSKGQAEGQESPPVAVEM